MKQPRSKKSGKVETADAKAKPFDIWLERGLHKMFDDVAREPIPDELLKLIEDNREK